MWRWSCVGIEGGQLSYPSGRAGTYSAAVDAVIGRGGDPDAETTSIIWVYGAEVDPREMSDD